MVPAVSVLVALSFTGRHRDRIRPIAQALVARYGPEAVFFDAHYEEELAQLDGRDLLLEKYRAATLMVVFLSPDYGQEEAGQRWTRQEWRVARDKDVDGNTKAVLPFSIGLDPEDFDGLGLDGLSRNSSFVIGVEGKSEAQVVQIITKRLERLGVKGEEAASERSGQVVLPPPDESAKVAAPGLEHVRSTEVRSEHIPRVLTDAYAEVADDDLDQTAVLAEANRIRASRGDVAAEDTSKSIAASGLNKKTAQHFWFSAFERARKIDSFMVASLLLAQRPDAFSTEAKKAREALWEYLTTGPR